MTVKFSHTELIGAYWRLFHYKSNLPLHCFLQLWLWLKNRNSIEFSTISCIIIYIHIINIILWHYLIIAKDITSYHDILILLLRPSHRFRLIPGIYNDTNTRYRYIIIGISMRKNSSIGIGMNIWKNIDISIGLE